VSVSALFSFSGVGAARRFGAAAGVGGAAQIPLWSNGRVEIRDEVRSARRNMSGSTRNDAANFQTLFLAF